MIIYVLLAAFLVGGGLGAGGMNWWNDAAIARHEKAQAEAQAKVDQAAKDAIQAAADHVVDMTAAYEAGESKAKIIYRTIVEKGKQNVINDSGLSNPVCVMSDDSLHDLTGALSGMRTATFATSSPSAVPGPGVAAGQDVQRPVPQLPQEHGAVGGVHPKPRPVNSSGAVQR